MFREDRVVLRAQLDEVSDELATAREELRFARARAARVWRPTLVCTVAIFTASTLALVLVPSLPRRLRGDGEVEWAVARLRDAPRVELAPSGEPERPKALPEPKSTGRPFDPGERKLEATWSGHVLRAEGIELGPKAKCLVHVMLNAKRHAVLDARVECAGAQLFDSYGRRDQFATENWRVRPTATARRDAYRYRVLMGSRLPGEGETTVNTFERKVTVWSTTRQFKVQIAVAADSEPVAGDPINQPDD